MVRTLLCVLQVQHIFNKFLCWWHQCIEPLLAYSSSKNIWWHFSSASIYVQSLCEKAEIIFFFPLPTSVKGDSVLNWASLALLVIRTDLGWPEHCWLSVMWRRKVSWPQNDQATFKGCPMACAIHQAMLWKAELSSVQHTNGWECKHNGFVPANRMSWHTFVSYMQLLMRTWDGYLVAPLATYLLWFLFF